MALPTFFIIGAPKAGTTSLHHYLSQHPQIQMAANKEPRFFAGPENGMPFAPGRVDSLAAYEALFDPAVGVRGEASTDYALSPCRTGVPQRIKAAVPDARLIYLVRDPLARTISDYRMRVAFLGERRTLQEALSDLSDPHSPYVWPSLYATQLKLYLEHFPLRRILVVDQVELMMNRAATLREIFGFLGVEQDAHSERFAEVLSDSRSWRAYPQRYGRALQGAAPLLQLIPDRPRRAVRRRLDALLWPKIPEPTLEEELRGRLGELYAREVSELRELTGRCFSSWSP